jgi:hypothetical protein
MTAPLRIDLDGVALVGETHPSTVLGIFRARTTDGIVLLMPESAEFTVSWEHVKDAQLDLANGDLRITFESDYVASVNWLRGNETLVGRWMDRRVL